MKCPKCGYIGFESAARCRNCGYEFALASSAGPEAPALDVRRPLAGDDGPLADLVLTSAPLPEERRRRTPAHELDLDRIIGAPEPEADLPLFEASGTDGAPTRLPAGRTVSAEAPLIAPPAPRRPLSVRRATPETPRFRADPASRGPAIRNLDLPLPSSVPADVSDERLVDAGAAAPGPRALAALIDAAILLAIDAAVIYFTLRLCALEIEEIALLPMAPLAAFLAVLNGGYLLAFTAASGQTIGKMACGLKVVGADRPLTVMTAGVRALLSALTLGLGLLPALLGGRAVHDRLAGTGVVRVRE